MYKAHESLQQKSKSGRHLNIVKSHYYIIVENALTINAYQGYVPRT